MSSEDWFHMNNYNGVNGLIPGPITPLTILGLVESKILVMVDILCDKGSPFTHIPLSVELTESLLDSPRTVFLSLG